MRRTRNKSKMIIFLCMTLLFMGIGYAALQSNLNISGTAKSTGIFGVQITNVLETQDSINNGGVSNKTEEHTTTTATFVTEFNAPGDYVEYKITVENTGTIDAVISAVINDTDNEVDENNRPLYIFTAIDEDNLDVTKYRDELNAGESKEITVKIKFNEKATRFPSKNITFTLTIDATQKAKSDYNASERIVQPESSCFVSFIPGEINYYDTSLPGCSDTSEITIPVDIALPVSTLNSVSMNTPLCMAFASPLKDLNGLSDDDISDSDFCAQIGSQVEQMSVQELYSSMYGAFAIPSYTIGTGQEETITSIGSGSFAAKNIETVSIPTDITEIKDLAFVANLLQTVSIPNTVTSIGDFAFLYNQLSGTLTIPSRVTTIGSNAFASNQITGISFLDGSRLTTIDDSAFRDNQLSGTLTIPSKVTTIGESAFINNQITGLNLTNATSLQTIGSLAFYNNALTGTLTISSTVVTIGGYAFEYNQITGLNLANATSLQTIGDYAFAWNQLGGTLTIPASVTIIGDSAFYGYDSDNEICTNKISSLVFENNSQLQTIGNNAFSNNQLSGTLTIPSSVTSIEYNAFYDNKINTLNLGSGLTSLGVSAFRRNYDSTTSSYTLQTINIDMTESTWNSRGLPTSGWYDGNVTPTYKSE